MPEELPAIPFEIDDHRVVEAYFGMPESCRSCPSVLELLSRVSMSATRRDAFKLPILDDHHAMLVVDVIADMNFMRDASRERNCSGPKEPVGETNSSRHDCPEQWLASSASSGAHYGLEAHVIFNRFVEARKPDLGFQGNGQASS
jgi:hypothetical protein